MKNKLTKLSLAVFLLSLSYVNAQTAEQRAKIIAETNVEALNTFSAERTIEFERDYNKAVSIAKEKGLPITGTNENGQFFSIYKYDEESDTMLYYITYNNTSTASSIKTIKANYLHDLGISGQNMIVGIWDGGIPRQTHQVLLNKVLVKDNGNSGMDADGIDHGTHVGGTMVSSGIGAGNLPLTKGVAYDAKLWAYNWNNDEAEMASAAAQGLLVSNHSYGLNNYALKDAYGVAIFGRYTQTARNIDIIANNAPYYLSVWAAGNDRGDIPVLNPNLGGKDILANEGVSKNNVVVAAINGIETYFNRTSAVMSTFSNYGPTDDFRIKPDISAKGVGVFSSTNVSNFSAAAYNGTSMAAPSVAAGFLLWQQFYHSKFNQYMKSSTVKALMAHTALEAGPKDGPDHMYGWGVLNIEGGATVINNIENNLAAIEELVLNNGETIEYDFEIATGGSFIATIGWNDPAGDVLNSGSLIIPRLVNDLDLRIVNVDTGVEYFPYRLARNMSQLDNVNLVNSQGDNIADNIEKVEIPSVIGGNYKVIISHKGNLTGGSQDVSLIMTGQAGPLSVEEKILNELKVYPNPTNDYVFVEGNLVELIDAEIEVYDISGKVVISGSIQNSFQSLIDFSNVNSGIYMMRINKNGAQKTFKIVKK